MCFFRNQLFTSSTADLVDFLLGVLLAFGQSIDAKLVLRNTVNLGQ